ncbi:triacylglycerol lipase 2-like isoform X4 [Nicotiana tomentosiformis]|uniref:triacylglycerol lipase 2-like isoform X4 n=1 Tax=Nicotiana tomentosiformis TaxID=4098 RepID=UPI00388C9556
MALIRKLITTILVVIFFVSIVSAARNRLQILSDQNEDGICISMVETQGYGCEEHKVTTEDGYILSLQRIPKGISGKAATKPPVLLQHGLLMDGITWLLNPPDQSLAFILADEGYDVWIANTRGTKYSQGHTSLSPQDPAYWEWSWDELVDFDLPATLKYVHDQTAQKLHYVGHSLGLYWLGIHEFDPRGDAVVKLLQKICQDPGNNCSDLMSSFTVTRKGTIEKYDYGNDEENNKHYGQPTPPKYIMANIPNDIPLFLGYGGADYLSDVTDVQTLLDKLQNHDPDKLVLQYREDYAHADFVFGMNAKQVVYNPLMAFFKLN